MKPVFESATSCEQIKMNLYGAQTLLPLLLWIPSRNGAIFLCIQKKEGGGCGTGKEIEGFKGTQEKSSRGFYAANI